MGLERFSAMWVPLDKDAAKVGSRNLRRLGRQSLHASIQAALVTRSGIVVQNALLHALVEQRGGLVVLRSRRGYIALLQGFAHGAQAVTELGAVGAVDGGALDGL